MQPLICAAIAVSLLAPSLVVAQDHAYTGLVFRLPSSARTLALGNVGIVGRDDDVLFYNPAQLVGARGTSASAERFSRFARGGTLSSVVRFNTGGIGIGATVTNFRAISNGAPVDRLDMRGEGLVNASSSNTLAVGIGQVFKSTRVGITGKYLDEPANGARNAAAVVDVGVARDFFGYSFGLAVQNIGPKFDLNANIPGAGGGVPQGSIPAAGLPLSATLGAGRGLPVGPFDLFATTGVSWLRDGFVSPAGGAELGYSWLEGYNIILRAGARRPVRGEGPVTAGAGFIMDRLAIDYAVETLSGGRAGHRIGLRVR
jgi:hypothetical protein